MNYVTVDILLSFALPIMYLLGNHLGYREGRKHGEALGFAAGQLSEAQRVNAELRNLGLLEAH